ncbi:radical SAM/SPASM domain-containing protein [Clostridium baratii]|uniref:radical SAM/SPASM domain-containing protein n=1 Tax=Clostridium baratii TaxID=1561 RepID=UPI002943D806|nr:radical SAM protein [Clostridium baratii]
MYISKDLLFIENKNRIIIYNYYSNKVVMVGNKTAYYIKNNIGKEVNNIKINEDNISILKKNGILIECKDKYSEKKFEIKIDSYKIETVYFHITQRCNLQCTYCYNKKNLNKREELSTENIFLILEKLYNIGVKTINITGGEALLRNDILDILKKAKEFGFQICLLTNGTLLNKKIEVFKYINNCIVSLDSINESENEITRKGSEKYKILESIKSLPKECKSKVKVRSVIVRGKENTIQENRKFFSDLGVEYIANMCLPNNKEELKNVPEFVPEFISGEKGSMCGAGKKIIAIDSNGDIYPCQSFINKEYFLGNILDYTWYELYQEYIKNCNLLKLSLDKKMKCKECEYKFLCLGGCPNIAYRTYGDIMKENEFLCELYKENARRYLISLFEGK